MGSSACWKSLHIHEHSQLPCYWITQRVRGEKRSNQFVLHFLMENNKIVNRKLQNLAAFAGNLKWKKENHSWMMSSLFPYFYFHFFIIKIFKNTSCAHIPRRCLSNKLLGLIFLPFLPTSRTFECVAGIEKVFSTFYRWKAESIWTEIHAGHKLKDLFIKYGLNPKRTSCATDKKVKMLKRSGVALCLIYRVKYEYYLWNAAAPTWKADINFPCGSS